MQEQSNIDIRRFVETFEKLVRAERRKQSLFGLKQSEVRVLLCIEQLSHESKQVITVSEISKKMLVTSPTVTELIKSLSTNGFIERNVDSQDKRVSDIKLTAKGEKIVQKLITYFTSLFSGLIEKIGEEQSETLLDLLDQVCLYLNETNLESD
ncbi:MarR family winged helix-turn-helix transcriptional regulator [Ruminiclostridium papyrosolvens]|uniref:MarR family transcriptional regulator n=1 Tax=Ruminiclostridium papyrosolvens C7 TaxID=1330534 RepID=U4R0Q6_9FIRM|nr:MarR family transcriptional regulator [Ruminiclostridium papyrosolvens C7]